MKNPCTDCDIEEKVHVCCGRHPETGARQKLQTASGRRVLACRFLDSSGKCTIYRLRPEQCRRFFCERFEFSCSGGGVFLFTG
ncbi:MAG: hypothetical protein ACOC0W_01365 [Desulfosalsimonas sp.]